ncbi:MAG TPA: ATPase, T2SS/T4P/T4SS family, partial [bacterium]|nr:ATPase, T2SS/T4P/T4SS family [bacterium]
MASIEKLGLATQEQTVLLDLLNHQHGLLIVVGEDAELRQVTLRTLQTYLESQHRQVAPFQPGTLICAEVLQAVGAVEESRPAPTVNYARSLPHFTPARPAVAVLPVIEDLGTLELACEQGLTGALVLATLEGVDGAGALAQLVHQGADAQLLAQSTLGV